MKGTVQAAESGKATKCPFAAQQKYTNILDNLDDCISRELMSKVLRNQLLLTMHFVNYWDYI